MHLTDLLWIIALVVLMYLGTKLPQLARHLGNDFHDDGPGPTASAGIFGPAETN